MISKDSLLKAAQNNIIREDQVDPLYQFIHHQRDSVSSLETDEPLKFVRSFGDVFIALGILLLVISINMLDLSGSSHILPVIVFVVLAEWLVRVRRLVLPGMVIVIAILFFVNKLLIFDYEHAKTAELALLGVTSLLFYLRYKMPFSLLPVAISLVAIIVIQIGTDVIDQPIVFVAIGVAIFVVAMWFDSQDTKRQTHLSDNAFWLHLLAAPLSD